MPTQDLPQNNSGALYMKLIFCILSLYLMMAIFSSSEIYAVEMEDITVMPLAPTSDDIVSVHIKYRAYDFFPGEFFRDGNIIMLVLIIGDGQQIGPNYPRTEIYEYYEKLPPGDYTFEFTIDAMDGFTQPIFIGQQQITIGKSRYYSIPTMTTYSLWLISIILIIIGILTIKKMKI